MKSRRWVENRKHAPGRAAVDYLSVPFGEQSNGRRPGVDEPATAQTGATVGDNRRRPDKKMLVVAARSARPMAYGTVRARGQQRPPTEAWGATPAAAQADDNLAQERRPEGQCRLKRHVPQMERRRPPGLVIWALVNRRPLWSP